MEELTNPEPVVGFRKPDTSRIMLVLRNVLYIQERIVAVKEEPDPGKIQPSKADL